jgi:molecular chaperone DnaK (HSP70)
MTAAVYDLGGGTFDAAVVDTNARRARLLGTTEGIERFGGIDVDEAILAYVDQHLGGVLEGLDPDSAEDRAAMAKLRRACVTAKEALSERTEATVPVELGTTTTELRLTRSELEQMVRAPLAETVEALRRALRTANVEPSSLDVVLLVGGASRMPIISELLSNALERPTFVSPDPKAAVAVGAAIAADRALTPAAKPSAPTPPPTPPPPIRSPRPRRLPLVIVGLALGVGLIIVIAILLITNGSSPQEAASTTSTTTPTTIPATTLVSGFTPQVEAEFVDRCVAGGEDRAVCECTISGMRSAMTFERFQAIDRQLQPGSSFQIPEDVVGIITACQEQASGGPTSTGPP